MDFLKALLLYLTLSTGAAVSATNVTPLPYELLHTPTPVVTVRPTPSPVPTPSPTPTPRLVTLSEGDSGTYVRQLQTKLSELGYMQAGDVDGFYGKKTSAAVRSFQELNGLTVDGAAGPVTLNLLYYGIPATPTPTP